MAAQPAQRPPELSTSAILWDGDLWDALLAHSPGSATAAHSGLAFGSPSPHGTERPQLPPPDVTDLAVPPAAPSAPSAAADLEGWSCADPSHRSNCIR